LRQRSVVTSLRERPLNVRYRTWLTSPAPHLVEDAWIVFAIDERGGDAAFFDGEALVYAF
jgi:hypothetical protein